MHIPKPRPVGTVILDVKDIWASIEGKKILKGISLQLHQGNIHVIMGPNGGGKSTLSNVIMGHPKYKVDAGTVILDGKNILEMSVDERAKSGIFLGFQYPLEIPGVNLSQFLRTVVNIARKQKTLLPLSIMDFQKRLLEMLQMLKIPEEFADRSLNEGFSGGEKKRAEILQMLLLEPRIAILDEPDSGLDIDSLRIVAKGIKKAAEQGATVLLITHYQRLLNHVTPDFIHVIMDGRVVKEGTSELALHLDEHGYEWLQEFPGKSSGQDKNGSANDAKSDADESHDEPPVTHV